MASVTALTRPLSRPTATSLLAYDEAGHTPLTALIDTCELVAIRRLIEVAKIHPNPFRQPTLAVLMERLAAPLSIITWDYIGESMEELLVNKPQNIGGEPTPLGQAVALSATPHLGDAPFQIVELLLKSKASPAKPHYDHVTGTHYHSIIEFAQAIWAPEAVQNLLEKKSV